jgi:hypothetical protein
MSATLDGLVREELNYLVDRLSDTLGPVSLASSLDPALRERLDRCDERLAESRRALIQAHAEWRAAIEEAEGLWGLVALRGAVPEPAPQAA